MNIFKALFGNSNSKNSKNSKSSKKESSPKPIPKPMDTHASRCTSVQNKLLELGNKLEILMNKNESNKLIITEDTIEKFNENRDEYQNDIIDICEIIKNLNGGIFRYTENGCFILITPYGNCSDCREARITKYLYKNGKYDSSVKVNARVKERLNKVMVIDVPLSSNFITFYHS